jgi:hypothetical protein
VHAHPGESAHPRERGNDGLTAAINVPNDANASQYNIKINTQGTTGAPSHNVSVSLTVAQDFLVTSSTASQTVTAGQTSGAYALRVLPVGSSFNGAVALTCSAGLPVGAQCIFNPSTPVTPGNSAVDVVMNISDEGKQCPLQYAGEGKLPSSRDLDSAGCDCDWRGRFGKSNSDKSAAIVRLRRFLPDNDGSCLVCRCERRRRWWTAASTRDLSRHGDWHLFRNAPRCRSEHNCDTRRKLKGFVAYDYAVVDIAPRPPA